LACKHVQDGFKLLFKKGEKSFRGPKRGGGTSTDGESKSTTWRPSFKTKRASQGDENVWGEEGKGKEKSKK